jgi:DNA-binding Xre family transcriptional regulator
MTISNRTKELVEQRGIKVKVLAEEAGLAYNTVYDFVNGHANRIDLKTLDRICKALKVQPGELLVWSEGS